jgi:adenine-specific DNA-methyltransferase
LGKVKMIYIDPPYNTGNDFVYEDDFAESTAEFLEKSNQVDEAGNRLVANTQSNGRFHSDWLSMMYSRWLCCTNPVRDSSRESSVVAGMHEQTHTPDLQDQELASLQ